MKSPQDTVVEEFHQDLETAAPARIKKIEEKLGGVENASEQARNRVQMLKNFGMDNHPEVKEAESRRHEIVDFEEELKLLQWYASNLPDGVRFIRCHDLNDALKKYGLVFGPLKNFIGQIPTANLAEIQERNEAIDRLSYSNTRLELYGYNCFPLRPLVRRDMDFNQFSTSPFNATLRDDLSWGNRPKITELGIACKKNELSGKSLKMSLPKPPPPRPILRDPVVFRPTYHGWLILTAWGKEADYAEFQ